MAQTKLKGHDSLWWKEFQKDGVENGELKITWWRQMVARLNAKFIPRDYELDLFKKLQNLKQRNMTVKEYTEELYKVVIRSGNREMDREKVVRYINRLAFNIQDEMSMLRVSTVGEAYQYALKAKENMRKRQPNRGKEKFKGQMSDSMKKPVEEDESKPKWSKKLEQKTQRKGSSSTDREFPSKCFKCGETEHSFYECKQGMARRCVENEELEGEGVGSDCAPKQGESVMFRRKNTESTQRKSLFWTMCKSGGKCCKVIIDSGSTKNLVSEEMVVKLELKRLEHPCPYKVSWLQDDQKIEVKEQCLVNFNIGSFRDEVFYDIVSMSAYHVLLGKP